MKDVKHVTVFLSCPGDMYEWRGVVEETIQKFNKSHTDRYHFDVFRFKDVASEFGDTPQNIINEQLPDFDIYIGLMGARFGTSTDRYGSGTEEEFQIALEKKKGNDAIHVSFLFQTINKTVSDMSSDELGQYLQVQNFKGRIQDKGCFQTFVENDDVYQQTCSILKRYLEKQDNTEAVQMYQTQMFTASVSDIYPIRSDFMVETLLCVGADLSNGHKARLTLKDIYVPLHVNEMSSFSDEVRDADDSEVVCSSAIDAFSGQSETKVILIGDESSGKSTLCKRIFTNFHSSGVIPVLISGAKIKNASVEKLEREIHKAFCQQYPEDALAHYKTLDKHSKALIIDDFYLSSVNDKNKIGLLNKLEEIYGHIFVAVDQAFALNTNLAATAELATISHFKMYKLRDMGHVLRDDMIQKWLSSGIEDTISEEELCSKTDYYKGLIDNVLGTNFVPKKPLIILILLQAIQGGSASDLKHSSFVRYYKYLIDTTLLCSLPKTKAEVYYSFLPELAYGVFLSNKKTLNNPEFEEVIKRFCQKKGLYERDLVDVKSNLISAGVIERRDEVFRFKHPYAYYYFLGQYLSDNITREDIAKQVEDICDNLHLKENGNILVFLSYHTRSDIIIKNVIRVANASFPDSKMFDFSGVGVDAVNSLISEIPKLTIVNGGKGQRKQQLKLNDEMDNSSQGQSKPDEEAGERELDALDFTARMNRAFRSMEIIGQLLKNHFANFDAEPKEELFEAAANVTLRCLNVYMECVTEKSNLESMIKQLDVHIKDEARAKKIMFIIASVIASGFIRVTAQYTGADTLEKTYADVVSKKNNNAYQMLQMAIKMGFFQSFPINDLQELAERHKNNYLIMASLRYMVKHRLYMRPIGDWKAKQKICDAVGLTIERQLLIEKKQVSA